MTGWSFLAADVFERSDKVIVKIEAPGMRRDDCNVALDGNVLTAFGQKRIDCEATGGQWRGVQSAYCTGMLPIE